MTLVRKVKYTCALCSYCVHTGGPEPLTGGAAPASDGARRPVPVISEDRSSGTAAAGLQGCPGNHPADPKSPVHLPCTVGPAGAAARVRCMLCGTCRLHVVRVYLGA